MPRPLWKGAVAFGLVSIPVEVHTAVREIFVPPTKRVFNVEVEPSAKEFLPGAKAKVKIRLTDLEGAPLVGSTVVAIYDKALSNDAIAHHFRVMTGADPTGSCSDTCSF